MLFACSTKDMPENAAAQWERTLRAQKIKVPNNP